MQYRPDVRKICPMVWSFEDDVFRSTHKKNLKLKQLDIGEMTLLNECFKVKRPTCFL